LPGELLADRLCRFRVAVFSQQRTSKRHFSTMSFGRLDEILGGTALVRQMLVDHKMTSCRWRTNRGYCLIVFYPLSVTQPQFRPRFADQNMRPVRPSITRGSLATNNKRTKWQVRVGRRIYELNAPPRSVFVLLRNDTCRASCPTARVITSERTVTVAQFAT
jgi:hypothetical protein